MKIRIKHSDRPGAQRSVLLFLGGALDIDTDTTEFNTRACNVPVWFNRGEVIVTLTEGPARDLVSALMESTDYSFSVERCTPIKLRGGAYCKPIDVA